MYFLDSYISDKTQDKVIVTLELRSESGTVSIRPVFKVPSALEASYFELSLSKDWFLTFTENENDGEYGAVMELNMNAADYKQAVNPLDKKLIKLVGPSPALIRDFDQ